MVKWPMTSRNPEKVKLVSQLIRFAPSISKTGGDAI